MMTCFKNMDTYWSVRRKEKQNTWILFDVEKNQMGNNFILIKCPLIILVKNTAIFLAYPVHLLLRIN